MELYKVRAWDYTTQEETTIQTTLERIIANPQGLNMIDVGIILLNEMRTSRNLKPIDGKTVSGSLEDLGGPSERR